MILAVLSSFVFAHLVYGGDITGSMTITENGVTKTTFIAESGGKSGLITSSGDQFIIKHGARGYFTDINSDFQGNKSYFHQFYLLGKTISFDVDLSGIACGCNAALYLISMPAVTSAGESDPTTCGDYYCDANYVCGVGILISHYHFYSH
jgi:hypothetical protein